MMVPHGPSAHQHSLFLLRAESWGRKGKGKGKAMTSSDRSESSARSVSFQAPSTFQHVNKVTPAAALVELHGSVSGMTKAIIAALKPHESTEDKAIARCQDAVHLVQERDDGLSISEKAALVVFFGSHSKEADMYHIGTLQCTESYDSWNAYTVLNDTDSRGPVNP